MVKVQGENGMSRTESEDPSREGIGKRTMKNPDASIYSKDPSNIGVVEPIGKRRVLHEVAVFRAPAVGRYDAGGL